MINDNKSLSFTTGIIREDIVYLMCREYAMLVAMDYNSGEYIWIKNIPDEDYDTLHGSWRIISIKDKLVIVPFNFQYIHIYDIKNDKWGIVDFTCSKKNANQYSEAFVHENKVIMIGAMVNNILSFNIDNNETKVINSYFAELDTLNYYNCRGGYAHIDDYIYIPISCICEVLKLSLKEYEYEVIHLNDQLPGFSGICYDGKYFWMPSRVNSSVDIYDKEFHRIDTLDIFSSDAEEFKLEGAYIYQDNIYIHGQDGKDTYIIDRDTKEITKMDAPLLFLYGKNAFLTGQFNDGTLYLKNKEKEKKIYPKINNTIRNVLFEMIKQEILCGKTLKETEELGLIDFINFL